MTDSQLLHCKEPDLGLFIVESSNVILRALRDGYEPEALVIEKRRLEEAYAASIGWTEIPNSGEVADVIAACPGVPIYTAEVKVLNHLMGYQLTGGIICALKRRELPSAQQICEGKRRVVVLEKVMNPINVGSIFRSAAALGIDAVLLTEGSADPLYRRSSRVSMGTVFQVPWTYLPVADASAKAEVSEDGPSFRPLHPRKAPVRPSSEKPGRYIPELQKLGFRTAALALTDRSVSIEDPELCSEEQLAIVMGTEGEGLFPETIEDCDYTVKIPMTNGVDSLNVAAASAVAFWQLTR